jgi:hypothetical protein
MYKKCPTSDDDADSPDVFGVMATAELYEQFRYHVELVDR